LSHSHSLALFSFWLIPKPAATLQPRGSVCRQSRSQWRLPPPRGRLQEGEPNVLGPSSIGRLTSSQTIANPVSKCGTSSALAPSTWSSGNLLVWRDSAQFETRFEPRTDVAKFPSGSASGRQSHSVSVWPFCRSRWKCDGPIWPHSNLRKSRKKHFEGSDLVLWPSGHHLLPLVSPFSDLIYYPTLLLF